MINPNKFVIVGDNLAIDFINTEIMKDGKPKDLLTNFEDFIVWQTAAGLLKAAEAERLAKKWTHHPEAQKIFRDVLNFRKTLRHSVESFASSKPLKTSVVDTINEILHQRYGYHELVKTKGGFEKRYRADLQHPRQLLLAIAESAADLISSGDSKNVRKCESSTCILYFYDTTKNHRRRWCRMTACGNRAKAAAFYQRKRDQQRPARRKR